MAFQDIFEKITICKNENSISVQKISVIIQSVLEAISSNMYPVFLFCAKSGQILIYKYEKYLNSYQDSVREVEGNRHEGLYTYIEKKNTTVTGKNLFQCSNESYILHSQVCNSKIDCPNGGEDEKFCICYNDQHLIKNPFCNVVLFNYKQKVCSPLYFITAEGFCNQFDGTSLVEIQSKSASKNRNGLSLHKFTESKFITIYKNNFVCNDGTTLDQSLINDLVADCGPDGKDESMLQSILVNRTSYSCTYKYEIPCRQDHSRCFNLHDVCMFEINRFYHITPCRNGGHLQNCKSTVCNMRFKCKLSYCIPWNYVCNGRWECPNGEDEIWYDVCGNKQVCTNMYKCKNTKQICIHLGSVCNNKEECPLEDDEHFCDLKNSKCLLGCHCLVFGLFCNGSVLSTKDRDFIYLSVFIINCRILYFNTLVNSIKQYALIVRMPNNYITNIIQFCTIRKILLLDLVNNFLTRLLKNCFSSFHMLRSLGVNNNSIKFIESGALQNIPYLKFLNLSNNPLYNLPQHILKQSINFKSLMLYGFYIFNIDISAFNENNVKVIQSSDYYICCISPTNTICTPHKPWYISCSDILPKYRIKVLFRITSILILV